MHTYTCRTPRSALPSCPPGFVPECGGRTQTAINLQSQAENDWRAGSRLLKRDVQLDLPSKLLHVLDVILETVPSQVHLHF